MGKLIQKAREIAAKFILTSPQVKVTTPCCGTEMLGSDLEIVDENLAAPFESGVTMVNPVAGKNQYVEKGDNQTMMALPKHVGVSPSELLRSKRSATAGVLAPLYNTFVEIHNNSPQAGEKTFVWGAGDVSDARYLFLGEAPGWQEDKFGIPFIGDAGSTLSSIMKATLFDRVKDCMLINTMLVAPDGPGGKIGKPTTADLMANRPRVIEVIRALASRPCGLNAVVCLGKYAHVQLFYEERLRAALMSGQEMNLRDVRMKDVNGWNILPDLSMPVFTTYHPSFIRRAWKSQGGEASGVLEMRSYVNHFNMIHSKKTATTLEETADA